MFRLQITRLSLGNGRLSCCHTVLILPFQDYDMFFKFHDLNYFSKHWALSKIRAQCSKISVGKNPACIELRLHKEL